MQAIVDIHGHVTAPLALYAYQAGLMSARAFHGKGSIRATEEEILEAALPHVQRLKDYGISRQFISPRPYSMMHSRKPEVIVQWFIETVNDIIAAQVAEYPDSFVGVAGLPQSAGVCPSNSVEELRRCVLELGFVGCVLNPDPGEGDYATPGLGDEWWYPLYEAMVELDVPGLVHATACSNPRESYSNHFITEESIAVMSLVDSNVFTDFPDLKLIISHGGGSVPYQYGRWQAQRVQKGREDFSESLKRLWFDTVLYNKESLELLFKIVGPERCLFGTETPGIGSGADRVTGQFMDDLAPVIDSIDFLGEDEKAAVFSGNAREVFSRWNGID
ncbi:MAG: amidohydrolase [Acidimicrobiaceae bacterium]|nr:amidohydrolase [Acidimicrobiaceae bacterium]HAQ23090.1 amidohydrolase [Acidimicrobiaceae bacterium]